MDNRIDTIAAAPRRTSRRAHAGNCAQDAAPCLNEFTIERARARARRLRAEAIHCLLIKPIGARLAGLRRRDRARAQD